MPEKEEQFKPEIEPETKDESKKDIPETYIPEEEKAMEMAKVEDSYRSLAERARKTGVKSVAEKYEKMAGEKAEQAGKEWEERQKEIEQRIEKAVNKIFEELEKLSPDEQNYGIIKEDLTSQSTEQKDFDFVEKLDQVLGTEKLSCGETTVGEGNRFFPVKWYITGVDRVRIIKEFDERTDKVRKYSIDLLSEEEWKEFLEKTKAKKKERTEGAKEK